MGATCSGDITNVFKDCKERSSLKAYANSHLRMYCRFIDDIAFIYEGSTKSLNHRLKSMNFISLTSPFMPVATR